MHFPRLGLKQRLLLAGISLSVAGLGLTTAVGWWQQEQTLSVAQAGVTALASADMDHVAQSLTAMCVAHDEGLRETYAGDWQGLTHEEIIARHGEQYAAWKRGEPVRRGGGELETEVADRAAPVVLAAADELADGGVLVVVSHGGTIRTTIGRLLGLDPLTWESLGGLSNCCWSVLGEGARGWRLTEHNAGTLPEPVLGDVA